VVVRLGGRGVSVVRLHHSVADRIVLHEALQIRGEGCSQRCDSHANGDCRKRYRRISSYESANGDVLYVRTVQYVLSCEIPCQTVPPLALADRP
jgi:hypothetical protein